MKASFATAILLIAVSTSGQQLPSREVQDYSLEAPTFLEALLKASADFQFPLGVEWVKSADTLKPVQLSRSSVTAEEVIQAVVSMHAGYEWRLEDGVVHVFNTALMGAARNPLNAKLQFFGFTDCNPMIARMAEVYLEYNVRAVVAPKIGGGFGFSIGSGLGEPKIQFRCTDLSARYVLNKIVALSIQHVWIATFPAKTVLTPTGFLEEVPILGANWDRDEPFWVLRRWGDPPPEKLVR
ncbi:MAG: hypothetical protein WBL61_22820 [Bryobacteraceae bacterium]